MRRRHSPTVWVWGYNAEPGAAASDCGRGAGYLRFAASLAAPAGEGCRSAAEGAHGGFIAHTGRRSESMYVLWEGSPNRAVRLSGTRCALSSLWLASMVRATATQSTRRGTNA